MFNHDDEIKLLRELLEEQRATNGLLVDENALLRLVAAEQIASKQLLQVIVNNTNPKPLPTSFKITQTR